MTSVAGHITNNDFPKEFGWNNCSPVALFDAPTKIKVENPLIADNITQEAQNCDALMIWTDCDREGEYIGWEVVEQAKKRNPRITLESTYRARFSHLERSHILQAARNPIRLDLKAIDAVKTRMEVDLRTGACLTRFLTNLFKGVLGGEKSSMISYGGCQFPTLGFVVDRYKRIKLFVKEPFWLISLTFKKKQKQCPVTWERGHLFDRLITTCIYQNCLRMEDSEMATILSVATKPTSNWAPLPLTTVEMQKDCGRFFKLTAKDTLAAAETLYTRGFISYPRTETDTFPKAMDLKGLVGKQMESAKWGSYAKSLVDDGRFRQPRQGKHSDEAHPPIHPIIFVGDSANLTGVQKTVYEYVVRRFLACCSPDAKGFRTTIRLQWGTEFFRTSGLVVKENGYLEVFIYSKWKSSKNNLPEVEPGERVKVQKAVISSGMTEPPKKLTETELIALMDANGIGTDATIAEHIEKIKARNYVTTLKVSEGRSKRQVIVPTELGYGLVEGFNRVGFNNISLTKPFLRRSLEEELKRICEGQATRQNVLVKSITMYKEAFALMSQQKRLLLDSYRETIAANS
ncbi:DEKNAAC105323 [Brettanomyces naardenensis]|uniref:DNA topoisomerase n=1 Tax=Brettanomyces naardenensis TaxID=13370 RepID=A0A448YT60_BRENA|nr:DEKNAAC105323 [Brettanomyces naardenensis]